MIEISEASISRLIVHKVGNSITGDGVTLSDKVINNVDEHMGSMLMHYFFAPFKGDAFFRFTHPSNARLNVVYECCANIFGDEETFCESSRAIAAHLYEASQHPNIKQGELWVALINDVIVDGEVCDAIGIFKSENKETIVRVCKAANGFDLVWLDGINPNKIDKGCLIFNTEKDNGFKVCAIDNTSKNDTVFWKEFFLQVAPVDDDYHQTRHLLQVCKEFVKAVFNTENEVPIVDQVAMLNGATDYFKTNETFDVKDFESKIMQQPEIVEAFEEYRDKYQKVNQVTLKDEFPISAVIAKNAAKCFKNVIKLDKNFHIYVHGGAGLIEKGVDSETGKSYYKLYFDNEQL